MLPTKKTNGFTLLEFLIILIFISLLTAWGLPSYRRQVARQNIDRYVQRIEAGLYSLRAKQGVMKTTCRMQFPSVTNSDYSRNLTFASPSEVVEVNHLDAATKINTRLSCWQTLAEEQCIVEQRDLALNLRNDTPTCSSRSAYVQDLNGSKTLCDDGDIKACTLIENEANKSKCAHGEQSSCNDLRTECINGVTWACDWLNWIEFNEQFRYVSVEGSRESKKVEVSTTKTHFAISPPGTSTAGDSLVILVRSIDHASFSPALDIRCVEFTGNGLVKTGVWTNHTCTPK